MGITLDSFWDVDFKEIREGLQSLMDAATRPPEEMIKERAGILKVIDEIPLREEYHRRLNDLAADKKNLSDIFKPLDAKNYHSLAETAIKTQMTAFLKEKNPDSGNPYEQDFRHMIATLEKLEKGEALPLKEVDALKKLVERRYIMYDRSDSKYIINDIISHALRPMGNLGREFKRHDAQLQKHPGTVIDQNFRIRTKGDKLFEFLVRADWEPLPDGATMRAVIPASIRISEKDMPDYARSAATAYDLPSLKTRLLPPELQPQEMDGDDRELGRKDYEMLVKKSEWQRRLDVKPIIDVAKLRQTFEAIRKKAAAVELEDGDPGWHKETWQALSDQAIASLALLEAGKPITARDANGLKATIKQAASGEFIYVNGGNWRDILHIRREISPVENDLINLGKMLEKHGQSVARGREKTKLPFDDSFSLPILPEQVRQHAAATDWQRENPQASATAELFSPPGMEATRYVELLEKAAAEKGIKLPAVEQVYSPEGKPPRLRLTMDKEAYRLLSPIINRSFTALNAVDRWQDNGRAYVASQIDAAQARPLIQRLLAEKIHTAENPEHDKAKGKITLIFDAKTYQERILPVILDIAMDDLKSEWHRKIGDPLHGIIPKSMVNHARDALNTLVPASQYVLPPKPKPTQPAQGLK